MNVIFVTLGRLTSLDENSIYHDLMREFVKRGDNVYIVTPAERRSNGKTELYDADGAHFLKVRTLNVQKTSMIEKGLSIVMLEWQYNKAIKKYLSDIQFDLILYTTPPITLAKVVKSLKERNPKSFSYLLLKDIFPQNSVDMGVFSKSNPLYKVFRKKEKQLYKTSDFIGCLSPANVEYLHKNDPYYPADRIEINSNSISLCDMEEPVNKKTIRQLYGLPLNKTIFIYGGNLGRPQGIDYVIRCMDDNKNKEDRFFVIVGAGTELPKLKSWYNNVQPSNIIVMDGLSKGKYDELVQSCDVGLIFLDRNFLIPNYPSRLLSYLKHKMPVISATDVNTDVGRIAEENGYGFWCESAKPEDFTALVDKMLVSDIKKMGEKGYEFLKNNYLVEQTYDKIVKHLQ